MFSRARIVVVVFLFALLAVLPMGAALQGSLGTSSDSGVETPLMSPIDEQTLSYDNLIYSTFLGGSGMDIVTGMAIDPLGNAYITGYTDSPDLPTSPGAIQPGFQGDTDAFVIKLNHTGQSIDYCTYIGGSGQDEAQGIQVDEYGNAFICGETLSSDFPTTLGAYDRSFSGEGDAFVVRLNRAGSGFTYSTFLGGTGKDSAYGIDIDEDGYAYVTGETSSLNYPATPGSHDVTHNGGEMDAFVTKLETDGLGLVYSFYLGGNSGWESGYDIAVDSVGCAFVTGYTWSENFPVTVGCYDEYHNKGSDMFLTRVNRLGTGLSYSTFIGGKDEDTGMGIDVDQEGNAYVVGGTSSPSFPITPSAFDTLHNQGTFDAVVLKMNRFGDALEYSTFLGGYGWDMGNDIVVDSSGEALVTGFTSSLNFPVTAAALDKTFQTPWDAFMTKLDCTGEFLEYSSLLGTGETQGVAIGLDCQNITYLAGTTHASDFPLTGDGIQQNYSGGYYDVFHSRLDMCDPIAIAGPNQTVVEGTVVILNGSSSSDNRVIVNYTWSFNDGTGDLELWGSIVNHQFDVPGNYSVLLTITDNSGNQQSDELRVTIIDISSPVAVAGPDMTINEGTMVHFNGSGSTDNVGIVNYTWTFLQEGAKIILAGPGPIYNFTVPGTYYVGLNVTDDAGNWDTDSITIEVIDITKPIARAGRDNAVYQGTTVRFDASLSTDNVGIVSYVWTFNDGAAPVSLEGRRVSHTFDVPGRYTVELQVADAEGNTDTDQLSLIVLENVKPNAVCGPDLEVGQGNAAIFDGSGSTDNVGVRQWRWTFFDGLNNVSLYGVSPEWIFTVPGTYQITLNATDAARNWDTDSFTVMVEDILGPEIEVGKSIIVNQGEEAVLDASSSWDWAGIRDYEWAFIHNGTETVLHGPQASYIFWEPGVHEVALRVTDNLGHESTANVSIVVLAQGEVIADKGQGQSAPIALLIGLALVYIFLVARRRMQK